MGQWKARQRYTLDAFHRIILTCFFCLFSLNLSDAAAVTAPNYVLEESLSSQKLWKVSAGTRPPQPVEERAFFEKMWAQNFARSQVEYQVPVEVLSAASPISMSPFADGNNFDDNRGGINDLASSTAASHQTNQSNVAEVTLMSRMTDYSSGHDYNEQYNMDPTQLQQAMIVNKTIKGSHSDENLTVLIKGDNVFGTTVSKSFARPSENGVHAGVDTINISIASYRVVEVSQVKSKCYFCQWFHCRESYSQLVFNFNCRFRAVKEARKVCSISSHLSRR